MSDRIRYAQSARIPTVAVEWGQSARQGKRAGRTVMGAMADPPRGVKHYADYEHADGVTPAIWAQLRVMDDDDVKVVIGALQAGLSEDRAFRLGYGVED